MLINWTDPQYRNVVKTLRALRKCTGRPMKAFIIPVRGPAQTVDEKD
jgi:hypothetical protein